MSGRALTSIVAMALVAGACTGGSSEKTEGLPAGHGGTLTVVMTNTGGAPYEPGDFDPQETGYASGFEMAKCCLVRTLMSYNGKTTGDGGGTPNPDLASGFPSVSSDGLTWTFLLKRGLHYAPPLQSTEIVAQDVIRGLERALAPVKGKEARTICGGTPCQIGGYFAGLILGTIQGAQAYADGDATTISGLEAPDPYTLRVHLTHPSGDAAYVFALPLTSPIPQKPGDPGATFGVATGHNLDYGHGFTVASGPYMVEGAGSVDYSTPAATQKPATGAAKSSFTLVRNPSWDPASDDLRVAYPDRIVVVGAKNLDAGERMVQHDTADLVFDFTSPPSLVDRYQASPDLRRRVFTDPFDTISVMTMNLAVRPLDDVHVRRAINLAIDKSRLRPILKRYVTNSSIATHVGLDSEEENLLQNYAPFGDGSGDLGAAKAEMARSRYDSNGDGMCDSPVCRKLTIAVPSFDPARTRMADAIREDLRPLGIEALVAADDATWFAARGDPSARVPLALFGYFKDYQSASEWFTSTLASRLVLDSDPSLLGATGAQLRKWGYTVSSVPNVDARMRVCEEQAFAAQVTCWATFDQYVTERVVPWVPLLAWTGAFVVSSRVTKFSIDQSTPFPAPALDRIALSAASQTP